MRVDCSIGCGYLFLAEDSTDDKKPVEVGAFGLSMPSAGMQHDIKNSVWSDPHVGGQHGFVEWVRAVVDEQTLLAVPLVETHDKTSVSRFEAWRPVMENTCGNDVWEMDSLSKAWADEWSKNQQYPFLYMSQRLNDTGSQVE